MHPIFQVHKLNSLGIQRAEDIANLFNKLLTDLEKACDYAGVTGSTREMSIVKTKLEEACFFAKKAMASQAENQQ